MQINFKKILKFLLFFIIFTSIGFLLGYYTSYQNYLKTPPVYIKNFENEKNLDFSIFWETWKRAEEYFIDKDKIDPQKMLYGAIKGMVAALDDPYTQFFDPQETKDLEAEISGKYEGVGMEIGIKNNVVTVITPFPNTPAEKAGIRTGDQILKIDDTWTENLSLDEAARKIRGPKGTEVKLLIYRSGFQNPKEFILKRDEIKIPTLEVKELDNNIVLVRVYQFNEVLMEEFLKKLPQITQKNNPKIILDLRNNPGGLLQVAQQFASYFLKRGDIVTIEDGGIFGRKELKSFGPGTLESYTTVILINQGSASAAEIVAGALRDNRSVKLIGEKTFGKGSVQSQIKLSDGSSLKVTIEKWYTPKGDLIDKKGLEPDIKVEFTDKDYQDNKDPQLEKAIEIIKDLK